MEPLRDAHALGISLSPAQAASLATFHRLLLEKAVPMGMVGERDSPRLYERHILDSLIGATAFNDRDRRAFDLGSGAGLPGIVLAIVLPGCSFGLIESRGRRAGFLELAASTLGLSNVEVIVSRVEDVADTADVATARAFAPAPASWLAARRLLGPAGRLIYYAGATWSEGELAGLKKEERPRISVLQPLETSAKLVIMSRQ